LNRVDTGGGGGGKKGKGRIWGEQEGRQKRKGGRLQGKEGTIAAAPRKSMTGRIEIFEGGKSTQGFGDGCYSQSEKIGSRLLPSSRRKQKEKIIKKKGKCERLP